MLPEVAASPYVLWFLLALQALSTQQQQLAVQLQQVEHQLGQCAEARVNLVVLRGQVSSHVAGSTACARAHVVCVAAVCRDAAGAG
jgi:hypothetical protein